MKKDIRKIAEKAGFEVKIYRHGCYTVYVLNKEQLIIRLCRISDKGVSHFEVMTNCNMGFANTTNYPLKEISGFDNYKFALANGKLYALLTMDEAITMIQDN